MSDIDRIHNDYLDPDKHLLQAEEPEPSTTAEIEALIARLRQMVDDSDESYVIHADDQEGKDITAAAAALAAQAQRIAELERENAAIRTLMNCYNLGGWTDSIQVLQRAEKAEAALRQARDWIAHMRVPQNIAQAGLQVWTGGSVLAACNRALGIDAAPAAPGEKFICPQRKQICTAGCPYPAECPEPAAKEKP